MPIRLPDKASFSFDGTHLNAAYAHPLCTRTAEAAAAFLHSRAHDPDRNWPVDNPRDAAVALFAKLINADAHDVAVVPSTLIGENLIASALGLGADAGVVTDPFHYDASLVLYGELHKRGMPLELVTPRDNRIDLADLDAAIRADTRLVAISLVSSDTGYLHDLHAVCEIAHRKGAMVYADVIQAAGAVSIDVKAAGVDFCCAGTYKWLMGEFGTAFLYVRPDRLRDLKRVQFGWRSTARHHKHFLPFDEPGPLIGDWELGNDAASRFEVSTPSWVALAAVAGSLSYIHEIGVGAIARHRAPLLQRLQDDLPKHGFLPLTSRSAQGPYVVFAYEGVRARFGKALSDAKIYTTIYRNKIRIAPSVHSDMHDIERLLQVLSA
ncbi:MAG: hypothetical protein JWM77_4279 [Rhodospirillales bacterium]|nr:hypothetical protein [Rhodospirillales bacterium]